MQLTYNGVDLGWIQTQSIQQEVEYSDDGVDYLQTKVSIGTRSILNLDVDPPAQESDEEVGEVMSRIRALLEQPRKTLTFVTGSKYTVFSVPLAGAACDVNNGPKPRYLKIVSLNEKTWGVEYAIDFWIREGCTNNNGEGPVVLSNRWAADVEIDQNLYTKRNVTGILRLRADTTVSPDSFRSTFLPALLPTFVRTNMRYAVSSDQTRVDYQGKRIPASKNYLPVE